MRAFLLWAPVTGIPGEISGVAVELSEREAWKGALEGTSFCIPDIAGDQKSLERPVRYNKSVYCTYCCSADAHGCRWVGGLCGWLLKQIVHCTYCCAAVHSGWVFGMLYVLLYMGAGGWVCGWLAFTTAKNILHKFQVLCPKKWFAELKGSTYLFMSNCVAAYH